MCRAGAVGITTVPQWCHSGGYHGLDSVVAQCKTCVCVPRPLAAQPSWSVIGQALCWQVDWQIADATVWRVAWARKVHREQSIVTHLIVSRLIVTLKLCIELFLSHCVPNNSIAPQNLRDWKRGKSYWKTNKQKKNSNMIDYDKMVLTQILTILKQKYHWDKIRSKLYLL